MEKIYESGLAKAIGISNHSIRQTQSILSKAHIPPAINQVRCSPFTYNADLHKFCQENNIALEAYSPLTRGHKLDNPALTEIASRYKKSTAQILIRWALQKGMIVIPKSSNQKRIRENADVFDFAISDNDMSALDAFS